MTIQWYNAKTGSAPIVSLATYGVTFSSGALDMLDNPQFIMMGFDKDKNSIVVQPCSQENDNTIEFIAKKRNGYVRISNKDFIRFIESVTDDTVKITKNAAKYLAKWDNNENLLLVSLDKPLDNDNSI